MVSGRIEDSAADRSYVWRAAAAFGCISASVAALNSVFVTHYVSFFRTVSVVPDAGFFGAQIVYMLWNMFNDPIFGVISDRQSQTAGAHGSSWTIKNRMRYIFMGGAAWCFWFAIMWSCPSGGFGPWASTIHCAVVLCIYDAGLTLVEVNLSAMLADIHVSESQRSILSVSSSVGSLAGSAAVFVSRQQQTTLSHDLTLGIAERSFQNSATMVALVAALALGAAGGLMGLFWSSNKITAFVQSVSPGSIEVQDEHEDHESGLLKARAQEALSLKEQAIQIFQNVDFRIFCGVSFIQVFECTFEKNFLAQSLTITWPDASQDQVAAIISSSFFIPHVVIVVLNPVIQRYGAYKFIKVVFLCKLACSILVLYFGSKTGIRMAVYAVAARVLTEVVCRTSPLIISNLVDHDRIYNSRASSKSGTIVGAANLVVKPAVSLAPMLGWSLSSKHKDVVPFTLVALPVIVCAIQLVAWSNFSLHGKKLQRMQKRKDGKYYSDDEEED